MIYQHLKSVTSTNARYKNVQEITVGYVKKIAAKLGNSISVIKCNIWGHRHRFLT